MTFEKNINHTLESHFNVVVLFNGLLSRVALNLWDM